MTTPFATLNDEQSAALAAIQSWLADKSPNTSSFFVLSGPAGTGKTFLIRALSDTMRGKLVFTAPTNKATKVLRQSVMTKDYKPDCRTIYSLLGLRLEASGEIKELAEPEDPIDLSSFRAVIVDEGSMVNRQLMKHIEQAAMDWKVKFLFLGDAAQLPPVKEQRSLIWEYPNTAALTKIMRHDNQILVLANRIRAVVDHPLPSIKISGNHDDDQGVWSVSQQFMQEMVVKATKAGVLSKPDNHKIIAWRNITVDSYNKLVRTALFDNYPLPPWLPTDRVIFTAPAKDPTDDSKFLATTDQEGTIDRIAEGWHPIYPEFKTFTISITLDDGDGVVSATVLHPEHALTHARRVATLLQEAKENSRKWRQFWDFKDAFHSLRHAYAITAHRSQGSTYDTAFVDWRDILRNPNRQEAYRCLYVACTRPKRRLILG